MRGIECAAWGVLTQELELKTSANGKKYCNFGCAVVTSRTDAGKDVTTYVRVSCFEASAQLLAATAKKGDKVYFEGTLTPTTWNAPDGEIRHGLSVSAFVCQRAANIGRHRPKRERFEQPAPASLPGMNGERPSASYCAGPSAPHQYPDGFDERSGDRLPF